MKVNVFPNKLDGKGMKFAVVVSRFNQEITKGLRDGCVLALESNGVDPKDIKIYEIPGSFEIPLVAKKLAKSKKFDAIIALGAVIRGDTPHFDYVCKEVADGVAKVAYDHEIPVIFGVITTNDLKQAQARAGNNKDNKGYEAGLAGIEMVATLRKINL